MVSGELSNTISIALKLEKIMTIYDRVEGQDDLKTKSKPPLSFD